MSVSLSRHFTLDETFPLLRELLAGRRIGLAVGIMADATNSLTGEKIAAYAIDNEYGSHARNIPPRPFLRSTFDANAQKYAGGLAEELAGGMEPELAMRRLGEVMAGDVKETVSTWETPPNSPATIERKEGRNTPLRDTGSMLKSITYRVDVEK